MLSFEPSNRPFRKSSSAISLPQNLTSGRDPITFPPLITEGPTADCEKSDSEDMRREHRGQLLRTTQHYRMLADKIDRPEEEMGRL